jgi:hypothetical protein
LGVNTVNTLGSLLLVVIDLQTVGHMDMPDDEYAAFFLNLAYGFTGETTIACRNTARLQRASESTCESTCGRSNQIVKRGGVRLLGARICPVPLRHLRVQPKDYRLRFYWQVGTAQRALQTLDADY